MSQQVGGQAVIEGVMMRAKDKIAVAVRKEDGDILVDKRDFTPVSERFKILKLPLFRGVVALFQSLIIGIQALTFSANQFGEAEEEELSPLELILTMASSFGLAVLLFVILPAILINLIESQIQHDLVVNFIEGIIKIIVFLSYIVIISRFEDINRFFQYHGAEHKVIYNYESDKELTAENAAQFSTLHPRCGTSFLLFVMVISILIFSFFGRPNLLNRILIHIAILPLVAGISYELIKQAGKKRSLRIFKFLSLPGIYLQKITTQQPDIQQIEVAIKSLEAVLEAEEDEAIETV